MTNQQKRDEAIAVYRLVFETWRFQVDSGWQRSNYFAAFETALLLGIGKIIVDEHWVLDAAACIFGIVLTQIWLLNDKKVQSYIDYWWEAVRGMERDHLAPQSQSQGKTESPQWDFAWKHDENARGKYRPDKEHTVGSYRSLMRAVPWLFTLAWSALCGYAIICWALSSCHLLRTLMFLLYFLRCVKF